MPSAVSSDLRASIAARDDLNTMEDNYDQAVDEFLRDLPIDNNGNDDNNAKPAEAISGVDEEIKVRKKRAPIAKLDEQRLLSDAGIPKLRRIAKTKLKFRGKGHEFKDMERLLNTYQLWLDDLYPRAKFKDALTMVEKLGHSKRMRFQRKEWIDATKPSQEEVMERIGDAEDALMSGDVDGEQRGQNSDVDSGGIFGEVETHQVESNGGITNRQHNDVPQDDELDALMAENNEPALARTTAEQTKRKGPFEDDDDDQPEEDELDALLAGEPSA